MLIKCHCRKFSAFYKTDKKTNTATYKANISISGIFKNDKIQKQLVDQ